MNYNMVRVPVLGTQNDSFFCPPDLFFQAATRIGADPLFEPPPFACPCIDGLLIIYTVRRMLQDGSVDVAGGYILFTHEELEKEYSDKAICHHWKSALKPTDTTTMLRKLGFRDDQRYLLN